MDDCKASLFPKIEKKTIDHDLQSEKNYFCYPVVKQCLKNELDGKRVLNLSEILESKAIGLYAVNEFMDYMIKNMKGMETEIRLYDRNAEAFSGGYRGYEVKSYEQVIHDYKKGTIEKIVICNLTHGCSIAESLLDAGVSGCDIRLVDMFVYGMG